MIAAAICFVNLMRTLQMWCGAEVSSFTSDFLSQHGPSTLTFKGTTSKEEGKVLLRWWKLWGASCFELRGLGCQYQLVCLAVWEHLGGWVSQWLYV